MQFVAGHNCYSWLSWFQDGDPKEMIPVSYSHPCEPYVIALSDALPRYDERFRGRNQNKIEQLVHMAAWGFEWHLLPSHFVLHMPHAKTQGGLTGHWEQSTMTLMLLQVLMDEVRLEPAFRAPVTIDVPLPLAP